MTETQLPLFPYLEHQTADRPRDFIPVYEPWLGDLEEAYVLDAVRSGWISSLGKYVTQFEEAFAAFCGTEHGISVSSGTTALHLAAHALGIGPGDEVIVPSLTFIASGSSITHTGATPRFADVDPVTWTIDVGDMASLITPRTKAIMPVHLYGHPAPMDEINLVAQEYGLAVIEDAAESHGAKINDRRTGSLGHIGAFSFFPNKVITTGEGGMLTTNDTALAARCRLLRDHAMPPERRYWHDEVGFNYRLTNLQAAVGIAQMTRIDEFIRRKREIAVQYHDQLSGVHGVTLPVEREGCTSIFWLYSILVESPYACSRNELIESLRKRGIDSRPFFHPLDTLPPYHTETPRPTALRLSESGLNLPSSPRLTDEQITYVCDSIRELAGKQPA